MAEAFLLILVPTILAAALVGWSWGAIARHPAGTPSVSSVFIAPFLMSGPAMAADGHTIPIPPELVAELVNYAVLLLAAAATWVLRRVVAWLRIDAESKLVKRLEDGMGTALGFARERALVEGARLGAVDVRSRMVADAAAYLLPKMPQTLKALGIDAAGLSERLEARLPHFHDTPKL